MKRRMRTRKKRRKMRTNRNSEIVLCYDKCVLCLVAIADKVEARII